MAETSNVKHTVEVAAKVIRADGTVHDLGVIAATHKSLLKRLHWRFVGVRRAQRSIAAANAHAAKAELLANAPVIVRPADPKAGK